MQQRCHDLNFPALPEYYKYEGKSNCFIKTKKIYNGNRKLSCHSQLY